MFEPVEVWSGQALSRHRRKEESLMGPGDPTSRGGSVREEERQVLVELRESGGET